MWRAALKSGVRKNPLISAVGRAPLCSEISHDAPQVAGRAGSIWAGWPVSPGARARSQNSDVNEAVGLSLRSRLSWSGALLIGPAAC